MKKQKVAIVTDGTCSLTPAQGEEDPRKVQLGWIGHFRNEPCDWSSRWAWYVGFGLLQFD